MVRRWSASLDGIRQLHFFSSSQLRVYFKMVG